MKGRKPIPEAVKKMNGTDQVCRSREENIYERITKVSLPKELISKRAKRIYKERCQMLINQKVLQEPDLAMLAAYANTYDQYMVCLESWNRDPRPLVEKMTAFGVMMVPNPVIKMQSSLLTTLNMIGLQFGFSPIARVSMKIIPAKNNNEFDNFSRNFNSSNDNQLPR